ncbi:MAG: hypothetical protein ACE5GB_00045 [Acidimicrobiales bacterium]
MEELDEGRPSLVERLVEMVVEDAPAAALDRVVAAFGARAGDPGVIQRIAALLVPGPAADPALVGARGVDTATGRHLLYRAEPHDLTVSVYNDGGWRLIGQLLADRGSPVPTLVEVDVDGHRAATHLDPDTGEFEFEQLPEGRARLVFIGPHSEVIVDSIPLEQES